ncbi:MAG: copper chaperone PCu(A)C [Paracoccaceae bacterium]|nr:copper chaperone PCu(A)C [Paracoccaceae bacterium]
MPPFKMILAATAVAFALPAAAGDIVITDPYARVSTTMSKSGAAFMVIENHGMQADRLVSVSSDVADRTELHTHISDGNGVMQMVEVPEGFEIPMHGSHALQRGGDHVMFLGLKQAVADGDVLHLVLHFEQAGDVPVDVPVDLKRDGQGMMNMPMGGMQMIHGAPDGKMPMQMPGN